MELENGQLITICCLLLQDVDAWPGSDLALQEFYKKLNNLKIRPNNEYMNKISNKWKPFRGAAALILWHYYGS